ncbi:anti-sigma factor family protein [Actinopolymorpha singaporensis]
MAIDHPDGNTPPPPDRDRREEVLPCGRGVGTVYDHLTGGGLDDHELSCPHCRATAAGFAPVLQAARLLRDEPAEPPPGFVESVMARIHATRSRSWRLSLPAEHPLHLAITEHAAATVLAAAASEVAGVTVNRCHFPERDDPARLQINLTLGHRTPVSVIVERVRRAVRTAARRQLGLELHTIDVRVDDIHL